MGAAQERGEGGEGGEGGAEHSGEEAATQYGLIRLRRGSRRPRIALTATELIGPDDGIMDQPFSRYC